MFGKLQANKKSPKNRAFHAICSFLSLTQQVKKDPERGLFLNKNLQNFYSHAQRGGHHKGICFNRTTV